LDGIYAQAVNRGIRGGVGDEHHEQPGQRKTRDGKEERVENRGKAINEWPGDGLRGQHQRGERHHRPCTADGEPIEQPG